MKNNSKIMIGLIAAVFVIGAFSMKSWNSGGADGKEYQGTVAGDSVEVVLYKSPTCSCCENYVKYLKKQGFSVETIAKTDMNSVKQEYGIPRNMESCHTMAINGYVVEGHVPVDAINKLLTEKPAIQGIALPGMPAGSPGMPGIKSGRFTINALTSGGYSSVFMEL